MLLLFKRLFKPLPAGLLHLVFLILLIWQLGAPRLSQAQSAPDAKVNPPIVEGATKAGISPDLSKKNVLVLHSFEANAPVFAGTDRGLSRTLQAGGISSLNQFFESLELRRNPGSEYRKFLVEQMRMRYGRRKLDMIITMYPEALEFVLKDCRDVLPDVPILALYLPQGIELPKTDRRIIGHSPTPDIIGTLEIALKLVPGAKRVYVVSGAHEVDRRVEDQARRDFKKWEGRLEFQYLSHMSFEDILATISSTPRDSIILALAFSQDVTGKNQTTPEMARRLSQISTAPIFGILASTLGHGIVGGSLFNFEHNGTKAGELVLHILRGGSTEENFPKFLNVACLPMFDWRQLRRWKLNEAALPEGSIVIDREATVWDFKYYILGILVIGVVQWFLIAGLLAQRRRRAKADASLKERLRFERLLSDLSAKFLNIAPHEIDREIEGALKGIVDFFHVTHSILIKWFPAENRAVIIHAAHGVDVPPTPLGGNLFLPFPWVSKMVAQGAMIRVSRLDDLPVEAAADKETYQNLGVRSILVIPLFIEGSPGYAISISSRREERVWPEEYIPRLELMGQILISTMERNRAESSAKQKTEELDQFFNVTPDLLGILNTEGYFLRLNPAAERILGYSLKELTVKPFFDFIHPDDLDRTREAVSILSSQQKVSLFENRYRCKDGTYRWLQWNATKDGNLIYAAARDVTEHKLSEESLRKAEEKYRSIFEGALEGIYETSGEGKNLTANPALARMLGYDSADEVSSSISDSANQVWVSPDERAEYVRLLEERNVVLGYECQFFRKDGKKIWVSLNTRRVTGPDGQTLLYSGFIEDITERKRVEEAFQEVELKYRRLYESMRDAFATVDMSGRIQEFNSAYQMMLGYSAAELRQRTYEDLTPEKWHGMEKKVIAEQILPRGYSEVYEKEYRKKDGTVFPVELRTFLLKDASGGNSGMWAIVRDITERKRTEEALRESEKEAQRIAREALAMAEIGRIISSTLTIEEVYEPFAEEVKKIVPFDRIVIGMIDGEKGTVRNVYMAGGEIQDRQVKKVYPLEGTGYAEMLRTKAPFLLQPEDFKEYQDWFPMLLSTFQAGFRSILDVPLFSRGKIIGALLLRSYKPYAYTDEDVRLAERIGNQIAGAIVSAQLFLKEKQAEEALRESEERFRQVAENVGDFIWEVDAEGLYRYTSPSVERILGYKPDELVGKMYFYDLFAPEVREELKEAALKAFVAKQPFRAFPNPNVSKRGKIVQLETSGVPVLDADGNLVGYRGADTDVTERKKAEEELKKNQEHLEELVGELRKYQEHLEERVKERTVELMMATDRAEAASRAKSAFLANMSHELRTPLNSILGIGQLMERDTEFPQKHREFLRILGRSGHQLFELIDDILEMSRIDAGQTSMTPTTLDLHHFLDDLREMMILRAETKGLKVVFERDAALPKYVQTDGRKLRQILINLLSNAIKFTEKGRVTARVRLKEGWKRDGGAEPGSLARLEFGVEDTGIGIALEDREKIFEPFVQLAAGRRASEGTGLGLSLSRRFVAMLGGEITVQSEVGKGSVFKFEIEVQVVEGSGILTQPDSRRVIGLTPGQPDYRLLVVDDNLESRLLLRRLLEPVGFRVLEAASGPEAIDLYKDQPHLHLIWMDIRMPGMDGYEAARRIREAESERRKEDGKGIHTPIIALTAGVMENTGSPSHSEVFDDWVYKPFRETEVFDKIEKHLGVQFVCQPSVSSAVKTDNSRDKAKLSPADLSVLPADWLKEFFQTMEKGRSAQLLNLIDQIRPEHADLALALAEMVRIHQYEKLIPLTREALKEDVNG